MSEKRARQEGGSKVCLYLFLARLSSIVQTAVKRATGREHVSAARVIAELAGTLQIHWEGL
jgi:hypothetical protein